jgi:uncharacterized membrane protein YvlD (DUF360 family)
MVVLLLLAFLLGIYHFMIFQEMAVICTCFTQTFYRNKELSHSEVQLTAVWINVVHSMAAFFLNERDQKGAKHIQVQKE